ncbi:hypothetical protein BV898_15833 [Hypsibius exemplaris]|uniref:Receptor ligand binding region domain-containing protein n=1 Tax=Hypsibius exemplaris TaxID=2072580 RepID=A0A9X6NC14_HYPEX|nr:hypothetical protein BV898_15833 [Hypsibius exemplaris]
MDFIRISVRVFLGRLVAVLFSPMGSGAAVNFLSVHLGNAQSAGYNNMAMQPVFNYSLKAEAKRYPKVFENYTYEAKVNNNTLHCGPPGVEASIGLMTQVLKEKNSFPDADALTIFLVPLCGPSFAVFGDFARGKGKKTCTNIDATIRNKNRFPSTISLATADTGPYGAAVLAVMRYYGWRSIAIISDQLSGSTRAARNVEQCKAPLEQLYERRSEFEFLNIVTDSFKESFTRALIAATAFSHIILSCTLGEQQRRVMADAFDKKMMEGDYVFLHLYEMETPGEPPLSWFQNDTLDLPFNICWWSLVGSPAIDWTEFEQLKSDIMVGTTANTSERNEFEVSCYEAVSIVAKVLNESYDPHEARSSRFLAGKMVNRTYNLPLRPITLTPDGLRSIVAVVQYYDADADAFKTLLTYNSDDRVLRNSTVGPAIGSWAQGVVIQDRPLCGMRDQYCSRSTIWQSFVSVFLAAAVCLAVATKLWWTFYRWPLQSQKMSKFKISKGIDVDFIITPPRCTSLIQPLNVYGFRMWKAFLCYIMMWIVRQSPILFVLGQRDNNLLLESLILNQFSAPRYQPMWQHGCVKSRYIERQVQENFDTPSEYNFNKDDFRVRCSGLNCP